MKMWPCLPPLRSPGTWAPWTQWTGWTWRKWVSLFLVHAVHSVHSSRGVPTAPRHPTRRRNLAASSRTSSAWPSLPAESMILLGVPRIIADGTGEAESVGARERRWLVGGTVNSRNTWGGRSISHRAMARRGAGAERRNGAFRGVGRPRRHLIAREDRFRGVGRPRLQFIGRNGHFRGVRRPRLQVAARCSEVEQLKFTHIWGGLIWWALIGAMAEWRGAVRGGSAA